MTEVVALAPFLALSCGQDGERGGIVTVGTTAGSQGPAVSNRRVLSTFVPREFGLALLVAVLAVAVLAGIGVLT